MSDPDSIRYREDGSAQSFTGQRAVSIFAMATLESGLRLYAKTGIKPNRAYTPKAMIAMAEQYTGKKFKARDYVGAADALKMQITEEKAMVLHVEAK